MAVYPLLLWFLSRNLLRNEHSQSVKQQEMILESQVEPEVRLVGVVKFRSFLYLLLRSAPLL